MKISAIAATLTRVLHGILVPHNHVAGNGIQKHLQHAAGAVLGQHLDELDADHDVQRAGEEVIHFHIVAIHDKPRHPLHQRHNTEQQPHQHNAGQHHFQDARRLSDLVPEDPFDPLLLAVQGCVLCAIFGCSMNSVPLFGRMIFLIIPYPVPGRYPLFPAVLIKSYLIAFVPIKKRQKATGKILFPPFFG